MGTNDEAGLGSEGAPGIAFEIRYMMRKTLQRIFMLFGAALIVVAIPIAFVTPILPIGLPLAVIGAFIVLGNSDSAKRAFVRWRRRYPETGRRVRAMMRRMKRKRRPRAR